jgi:hypothetical protein
MEDFDIEDLDFDEYNREVYLEENPIQDKLKKYIRLSRGFNAQKKYKIEIDRFFEEYQNSLVWDEIEQKNSENFKKRKF